MIPRKTPRASNSAGGLRNINHVKSQHNEDQEAKKVILVEDQIPNQIIFSTYFFNGEFREARFFDNVLEDL